jgi:hypothetical protein
VAQLDSKLPIENMRTLPQQIRENVFLDRFITTLSAAFAILATLLAGIRLYGVLAYRFSTDARNRPAHGARRNAGACARHGAAAGGHDDPSAASWDSPARSGSAAWPSRCCFS